MLRSIEGPWGPNTVVSMVTAAAMIAAAGCSGDIMPPGGEDTGGSGTGDVVAGDAGTDSPGGGGGGDTGGADGSGGIAGSSGGTDGSGTDGSGTDGSSGHDDPRGFVAPTDDPCRTLTPTIRGTDAGETLIGTDGRDIIFAGGGDDTIWGNGGDDVICAGGGADRIYGGAGNDYIDAGFGRDFVDGGAGNDVIHGRSGGDVLRGSWGDDVLFGDLLDDELYGDEGDDLLIGGHGKDSLHGGPGHDWLRGDDGREELIGGAGADVVSFMTATPPGQPLGDLSGAEGMLVDVRGYPDGLASGDGYREHLRGVEYVVGSAFDDHITVGAGVIGVIGGSGDDLIETLGGTVVDGGTGSNTCTPTPCAPSPHAGRGDGPYVALATPPVDLGLVVLGSRGWVDDSLTISITATGVAVVRADDGAAITAGPGCHVADVPSEVHCVLTDPLRYIVGYGGGGNDSIVLEGAFPRDMTAQLDGGEGDDHVIGHAGQDTIFAGRTGNDVLEGRGGDDALLSLSEDGDHMDAGPGNDQLVGSYPCAGHRFVGGPGMDVGGFARVGTHFDTAAERHRQRIHAQLGYRAYQPAFCARDQGTRLANDIEILEGAGGDDVLIGNGGDNILWGWGGDDVMRGLDGHDTIEGHRGNDTLYGGSGRDRLRGGSGFDVLHARDGQRDVELSCGTDGRLETADPVDPTGAGCR